MLKGSDPVSIIVEIKHRETAQKFLVLHGGDNPESGVSIDSLAQLLADEEDRTARQITKYHLEIEDGLRQKADAMYALAARGGNMFALDLERHLEQVVIGFRAMKDSLNEATKRNG